MEEDLVSQGSDSEKRKGAEDSSSLSSLLEDTFPYYMAMGMSFHEYWEGDSDLAVYYRKAEEIRQEKLNWQLHLQGMYIYEAICCASPIFNPYAKKGTKPIPYPSVPYGVQMNESVDKTAQTKRAMDVFSAWASRYNDRREAENAGT